MINKDDLRVSTNVNELTSIVKQIMHKKSGFTLWQNKENDERIVFRANVRGCLLTATKLTIDFIVEDSRVINSSQKMFLLSPELSLLMKAKIRIMGKNTIKLLIDSKYYLKEKRKLFRYDLSARKMYIDLDRKIDLKNSLKKETVQVKDLSDKGCGFFITSNRAILFQPDSTIILNSLETVAFERPIKAIIRHVTPVHTTLNDLNNKLLLVGAEFEEVYPQIDTIIQKVEVKNSPTN